LAERAARAAAFAARGEAALRVKSNTLGEVESGNVHGDGETGPKNKAFALLEGIPGVGPVLATGYVPLIDTPQRFSPQEQGCGATPGCEQQVPDLG